MVDALKIYERRAKAKSQFNNFSAVMFVLVGASFFFPIAIIVQNGVDAWGEAFLSLIFVGIPLVLYPVVRRYGKLKEYSGPVFTLTKDGIIHDFVRPELLLEWQDIKCVEWGAAGAMSTGRMFNVVLKKRTFVGALLGFVGIHPFQYAESDLSLTPKGSDYYAGKSIERFLKNHAPAEIVK